MKGYVVGNKLNDVKLINKLKSRKICGKNRKVLVFAKAEGSKWEAQLGLEVYSYGQVFIVWEPSCQGNDKPPKPLGKCAVREKDSLIRLIDVVSLVILEGLKKKKKNKCEKVYLASLNESGSLHFWLLPRYKSDKEKYKAYKNGVSGYFVAASWLHKYLERSNDCRKRRKQNTHKGPFVPFEHNGKRYESYKQYAEECRKWFANGWRKVSGKS